MNFATPLLKGSLTHFKREERQIVTLIHEGSLTKSYSVTFSFPNGLLPQGTPQSKRNKSMEKSKQEGVNLGYLFISLFSCFCDFYHLYFKVLNWSRQKPATWIRNQQAKPLWKLTDYLVHWSSHNCDCFPLPNIRLLDMTLLKKGHCSQCWGTNQNCFLFFLLIKFQMTQSVGVFEPFIGWPLFQIARLPMGSHPFLYITGQKNQKTNQKSKP